jgi:protoporphyrinogen oxidase
MIAAAMQDLETIGIAEKKDLLEAFVVRIPKVYPVYHEHYQNHVQVLREYLESFENLQVMGRCGMFRYDNSDHALLSGLYAARNLYGSAYDLWNINTEEEYHEEFGPYNKPTGNGGTPIFH